MADDAFDLHSTFVHLGISSTAVPGPDFQWSPEFLDAWHTADVHEPGEALFVTPGLGTEHKAR